MNVALPSRQKHDDAQAAAITSAGMAVAGGTSMPVGALPKIDGLTATQGDSADEIDLSWNPIKRGQASPAWASSGATLERARNVK